MDLTDARKGGLFTWVDTSINERIQSKSQKESVLVSKKVRQKLQMNYHRQLKNHAMFSNDPNMRFCSRNLAILSSPPSPIRRHSPDAFSSLFAWKLLSTGPSGSGQVRKRKRKRKVGIGPAFRLGGWQFVSSVFRNLCPCFRFRFRFRLCLRVRPLINQEHKRTRQMTTDPTTDRPKKAANPPIRESQGNQPPCHLIPLCIPPIPLIPDHSNYVIANLSYL